jgi:type VI secretion system protein ImpC
MGAQSCQKPKPYFDPAANANAELSAKFNYLLCVSRFAHYLKVMARDLLAASVPLAECQRILSNWLQGYSLSVEECRQIEDSETYDIPADRPIADVALAIEPCPRTSRHELKVSLRPFYQLGDDLITPLRLVMQVPRLE